MREKDFFSLYLEYTHKSETPLIFHRWSAIACLAAWLERDIHFNFGHFKLYPNIYTMLMGVPGTKKSSAIKIGAKLLKKAGYKTFAPRKVRQEMYLSILAELGDTLTGTQGELDATLDLNLFGTESDMYADRPAVPNFICADEFNNFIGLGNLDFMGILGELWDYEGVYDHQLKKSKSIYVNNPTISILGGNTPISFAKAFPIDAIGQGFFSRILLIHADATDIQYTFPPKPEKAIEAELIAMLHKIKASIRARSNKGFNLTEDAKELADTIYKNWVAIEDTRFAHYTNRRFTHLLKLCLVFAASRQSDIIDTCDLLYANTVLSYAEHHMPKALGEFGRGKNADVTHRIIQILETAVKPVTLAEIWKQVCIDLTKRDELLDILSGLQIADKIQPVGNGYLTKKRVRDKIANNTIDWSFLTQTERDLL